MATARKPRLVFLVTEYYFFYALHKALASIAACGTYDVKVITYSGNSKHLPQIPGIEIIEFPWRRSNTLIQAAMQFLRELSNVRELLWRLDPDILHNIAMKPAIIGSLAAPRRTRIVNTITGFGFLFHARSLLARTAQRVCAGILRGAVKRNDARMIMHNAVDVGFATTELRLPAGNVRLIRGLGIDTDYYALQPAPPETPLRFLMITRLLHMKGVQIAVAAHQMLRERGSTAELVICGSADVDNPSAIPSAVIEAWSRLPGIWFLGQITDVRLELARSHVVVHPALGGEGLPRVLLEGAASGRALIATDVSGNSDIVVNGENGLLVPADDVAALAAAMEWMIAHPAERTQFGLNGRAQVVKAFAAEHVADGYNALYRELSPAA